MDHAVSFRPGDLVRCVDYLTPVPRPLGPTYLVMFVHEYGLTALDVTLNWIFLPFADAESVPVLVI